MSLDVLIYIQERKKLYNINSVALFLQKMQHYPLHRWSIYVILSIHWIYSDLTPCPTRSLCGSDEIIIASVDFFCFFSLKACLFDLSLITFKHHEAFECFPPCSLISFVFQNHLASKPPSLFSLLSFFHMYSSLAFSFHLSFI